MKKKKKDYIGPFKFEPERGPCLWNKNKAKQSRTIQKVPKVGVKDKDAMNEKCQFKMKGERPVISAEKFYISTHCVGNIRTYGDF